MDRVMSQIWQREKRSFNIFLISILITAIAVFFLSLILLVQFSLENPMFLSFFPMMFMVIFLFSSMLKNFINEIYTFRLNYHTSLNVPPERYMKKILMDNKIKYMNAFDEFPSMTNEYLLVKFRRNDSKINIVLWEHHPSSKGVIIYINNDALEDINLLDYLINPFNERYNIRFGEGKVKYPKLKNEIDLENTEKYIPLKGKNKMKKIEMLNNLLIGTSITLLILIFFGILYSIIAGNNQTGVLLIIAMLQLSIMSLLFPFIVRRIDLSSEGITIPLDNDEWGAILFKNISSCNIQNLWGSEYCIEIVTKNREILRSNFVMKSNRINLLIDTIINGGVHNIRYFSSNDVLPLRAKRMKKSFFNYIILQLLVIGIIIIVISAYLN